MNLMIVGGAVTSDLQEYLKKRGGETINVNYAYSSFYDKYNEIQSNLIRADKLIILIRETTNSQREFQSLRNLLMVKQADGTEVPNTFFDVKEIYLFTRRYDNTEKMIVNFKYIMECCDYSEYRIIQKDEDVKYETIYSELLGTARAEEGRVHHKMVYIQDRNDESVEAFEQDFFNKIVEPFSYASVETYDKVKEASRRIETGSVLVEDDVENNGEGNENNLQLGRIPKPQKGREEGHITIVSGTPRSGTSCLLNVLARSSCAINERTIVIDFSENQGTFEMFKKYNVDSSVLFCTISDFVLNSVMSLDDYRLIVIENTPLGYWKRIDVDVSLSFLINSFALFSSYKLFIDCPLELVGDIETILGFKLSRTLITTNSIQSDINIVKKQLSEISRETKKLVILNEEVYAPSFADTYNILQIKSILDGYPILKSLKFNPIEVDKVFYKEMMKL